MKKCKTFKLSDTSLSFVEKYALKELNINSKINQEKIEEILKFAVDCELNMIDENGMDKDFPYPEKERDILGDYFVSEVSGKEANNIFVDLEDLNTRLDLK